MHYRRRHQQGGSDRTKRRPGRVTARLAVGASMSALMALGLAAPASAAVPAAAGVTVVSAIGLPPLVQNPHVVARDNGQSTGYDGRSVWAFDDTELQDPAGFISNSGAVTADLNASKGITLTSDNPFTTGPAGVPAEIIPRTAAENAFTAANDPAATGCTPSATSNCGTVFGFWPGPVVTDPARHRVLVFYGKLCRGAGAGSTCASGFVGHAIGTGIVSLNMRTHTETRLVEHGLPRPIQSVEGPDPTLLFPPSGAFGSNAAIVVGKDLYAYGACTSAGRCALGRVPLAQVTDMRQWRYYAGTGTQGQPKWSTAASQAIPVMDGGAAGSSVAWDPALHAYLDIFMAGISSVADYELAPAPWGPWSAPQEMFKGAPTTDLWDYACFGHAELAQKDGRVQYVTYYDPGTGQQDLVQVTFAGHARYRHVFR
jgi:hypothetical protein